MQAKTCQAQSRNTRAASGMSAAVRMSMRGKKLAAILEARAAPFKRPRLPPPLRGVFRFAESERKQKKYTKHKENRKKQNK
jgi:hypothetical protein